MTRQICIDYDKCVGCRTCEAVCSLGHDDQIRPSTSRISVIRWEYQGRSVAIHCHQCDPAPCLAACPTGAMRRDRELGRQVIDSRRCIGCKSCVFICPFGAAAFNAHTGRSIKCDLCDGDPLCVAFCAYGALTFTETGRLNQDRQLSAARDILDAGQTAGSLRDERSGPILTE